MKKSPFLFAALLFSLSLFAQEPPVLGLKGGLNVSSISGEFAGLQKDSRLGLHVGALAHIHLTHKLALQPEVVYSGQGFKYAQGNTEHSVGLHYVNIPLQLQYMFDNGFRFQTGPQIGILADVTDKVNGQETGFFGADDFKTVDASWSLGLGYLTYSGLGVDARYNFGLSNINNAGNLMRKNRVFQLGLFYMFDSRHKSKSR